MIDTSRYQRDLADATHYLNQILELRLMRHRARLAAKQLRPIDQLFLRLNAPLPRHHPAAALGPNDVLTYHWTFLPTGAQGISEVRVKNIPEIQTYHIEDSDELLARWNRSCPSHWKYTRLGENVRFRS